jgi:putative endonuclease
MYYTYVLQSDKDNEYYIGSTSDLVRRYNQHEDGFVAATKNRRPLRLVYYEACLDLRLAREREKQLKTGFGRAYLKRRLRLLP